MKRPWIIRVLVTIPMLVADVVATLWSAMESKEPW